MMSILPSGTRSWCPRVDSYHYSDIFFVPLTQLFPRLRLYSLTRLPVPFHNIPMNENRKDFLLSFKLSPTRVEFFSCQGFLYGVSGEK